MSQRVVEVVDAEAMRELGAEVGTDCRAGDLVLLVGRLGAGKTTFTQGLAAGLEVSGAVTSPTFVIAREHPSTVGGPPLVHVDAYRLGGVAELDDLDLDSSVNESVTVVEWGDGLVEQLDATVIRVIIDRDEGDTGDADVRRVVVEWPSGRP